MNKFRTDWVKTEDFLIKAYFQICVIFLSPSTTESTGGCSAQMFTSFNNYYLAKVSTKGGGGGKNTPNFIYVDTWPHKEVFFEPVLVFPFYNLKQN